MNMGAWVESEILKFLLHNVDLVPYEWVGVISNI